MCTAAAYKTKDFYFGRTLDYEFSYGDEIAVTPRNYVFDFRHSGKLENHYAIIGMAHVAGDYPLYYDAINSNCATFVFAMPHVPFSHELFSSAAAYAAFPTKFNPAIPSPFSFIAS